MGSGKDPAREALAFTNQTQQQVLGFNGNATELACFVAGKKQHPPGSFGISLEHPPPAPPLRTLYGQTGLLHICNPAKLRKHRDFGELDCEPAWRTIAPVTADLETGSPAPPEAGSTAPRSRWETIIWPHWVPVRARLPLIAQIAGAAALIAAIAMPRWSEVPAASAVPPASTVAPASQRRRRRPSRRHRRLRRTPVAAGDAAAPRPSESRRSACLQERRSLGHRRRQASARHHARRQRQTLQGFRQTRRARLHEVAGARLPACGSSACECDPTPTNSIRHASSGSISTRRRWPGCESRQTRPACRLSPTGLRHRASGRATTGAAAEAAPAPQPSPAPQVSQATLMAQATQASQLAQAAQIAQAAQVAQAQEASALAELYQSTAVNADRGRRESSPRRRPASSSRNTSNPGKC